MCLWHLCHHHPSPPHMVIFSQLNKNIRQYLFFVLTHKKNEFITKNQIPCQIYAPPPPQREIKWISNFRTTGTYT